MINCMMDPKDLTKAQLVKLARANAAVIGLYHDAWHNMSLMHPDTPEFKARILAHPVLRRSYRPDLFDKKRTAQPALESTSHAVNECMDGLDAEVLSRTANVVGVRWEGKTTEGLAHDLCVALFCRLTKMDVPYDGPTKERATAWKRA